VKFCSACGSSVSRQLIVQEGRERYVCLSCGTTHYQNPRAIAICCAYWRDKILMCCRAHPPGQGQWAPPLGYLECGETIEEAAARETFEETGVVIDPAKLELYTVVNMTAIEQIAISFRFEFSTRPAVQPGPECLAVEFLSEEDISRRQLAWGESIGTVPQQLFSEIRSGKFSISLINIGSDQGRGFKSRSYEVVSDPQ